MLIIFSYYIISFIDASFVLLLLITSFFIIISHDSSSILIFSYLISSSSFISHAVSHPQIFSSYESSISLSYAKTITLALS
jgi:hypothetical protein